MLELIKTGQQDAVLAELGDPKYDGRGLITGPVPENPAARFINFINTYIVQVTKQVSEPNNDPFDILMGPGYFDPQGNYFDIIPQQKLLEQVIQILNLDPVEALKQNMPIIGENGQPNTPVAKLMLKLVETGQQDAVLDKLERPEYDEITKEPINAAARFENFIDKYNGVKLGSDTCLGAGAGMFGGAVRKENRGERRAGVDSTAAALVNR